MKHASHGPLRRWLLLTLGALLLLPALPGSGYVATPGLRWRTAALPVHYYVNPNPPAAGTFQSAVSAGTQTWNLVGTGDSFSFQSAGATSRDATAILPARGADGFNDWVWNTNWTDDPAALAVTFGAYGPSGEIAEVDTEFNGTLQWSANGAPGTYDLQSVALHEAGHWLHLGHSQDPASVMVTTLATGTQARVLGQDDVNGIRSLYGAPGQPTNFDQSLGRAAPSASPTSSSSSSSGGGGGGKAAGCFIATACYGSAMHPAVAVLRGFRDRFLLPTAVGRTFVAWYYRWSPARAVWLSRHSATRAAARVALAPLVAGAAVCVWTGIAPGWWLLAAGAIGVLRRRRPAP